MTLKQALPREATREQLASIGVDEDQTEWLLNLAWVTGQSRYRTTFVHYMGDDRFALVPLSPEEAKRMIRDSIYAGESCLTCKRAHNMTRIVINMYGFCAYGHYEHGNYQSYRPHHSERPKATFIPSGPQPVIGQPTGPAPVQMIPPVGSCLTCGGGVFKSNSQEPDGSDHYIHTDVANDTHPAKLAMSAPVATGEVQP
jgi:hypothetical protein